MDSSPVAAASPPSATNSLNSANNLQVDAATHNDISDVQQKNPLIINDFLDPEIEEDNDKYMKYEADYARRLMAKYFSKKDLYGGNIYSEKVTVDGQTIKSSRWPNTRSFADPVQGFENHTNNSSTSSEELPNRISNGKHSSIRSG